MVKTTLCRLIKLYTNSTNDKCLVPTDPAEHVALLRLNSKYSNNITLFAVSEDSENYLNQRFSLFISGNHGLMRLCHKTGCLDGAGPFNLMVISKPTL